jgi:hypothetical protein
MQPLLEGCKDAYIRRIFLPRIEVSSRASVKAKIQPLLEGVKDAYIWAFCNKE